MVQMPLIVRIQLAICSLVLLLPIVTIPLQDEAVLSRFQNRTLTAWPTFKEFLHRPEKYASQTNQWMADRAGPVMFATILQKRFLYYVLHTPPEPRVTLGKNAHIFRNGINNAGVNGLFENDCILSHSLATAAELEKGLSALKGYGTATQRKIYSVLMPMTPTLYADDLPSKVPSAIRIACERVLSGETPLRILSEKQDLNFVFPFNEIKSRRDDLGFFPAANYHPGPLSLSVARDAFLKKLGITTKIEQKTESIIAHSEILGSYGINKYFPAYVVENKNIHADDAANKRLNRQLTDLFVGPPSSSVFLNDEPGASGTVLMISDSVGFTASTIFASGFKRLIWVYTNGMRRERIDELINQVAELEKFDSILMLVNEGAVGRIITWASTLQAAASQRRQ
jgi:hypothetical protein